MTQPKAPLLDTHVFTATKAVAALAELMATKPQLQKILAHELCHPKAARKSVVHALEELIDAKPSRLPAKPKPEQPEEPSPEVAVEPEPVAEDTPESEEEFYGKPFVEVVAEDPIPDEEPYEPPTGENAEALIGETVMMTDAGGQRHEAVVVRDALPEERPVVAVMRDVLGTQVFLRHDPTGKLPLSWRLG